MAPRGQAQGRIKPILAQKQISAVIATGLTPTESEILYITGMKMAETTALLIKLVIINAAREKTQAKK